MENSIIQKMRSRAIGKTFLWVLEDDSQRKVL